MIHSHHISKWSSHGANDDAAFLTNQRDNLEIKRDEMSSIQRTSSFTNCPTKQQPLLTRPSLETVVDSPAPPEKNISVDCDPLDRVNHFKR